MDHFVTLGRFPEGLRFPAEFDGRIDYDSARRRLVFRGFMSKAEFDRLCDLSDDWGYRRQLEELFRQCTPDEAVPARGFTRKVASLVSFGFF